MIGPTAFDVIPQEMRETKQRKVDAHIGDMSTVEMAEYILKLQVRLSEFRMRLKHKTAACNRMENINRRLSHQILQARERQRRLVACELHDGIMQHLAWLKIYCAKLFEDDEPVARVSRQKGSEFCRMIDQAINAVRDLANGFREDALNQLDLVTVLRQHCEAYIQKNDFQVEFKPDGIIDLKLDPDTEIQVFRMVQEGLNNIRKHANADLATVTLKYETSRIRLSIEDDGQGFDFQGWESGANHRKRMGLLGMRERVRFLQGRIDIQSLPGRGTRIDIDFPRCDSEIH